MEIAVLREEAAGERRVALVPESVAALVRDGHKVRVAAGAGAGANIADAAYRDAGAEVVDDPAALVARPALVVSVRLPAPERLATFAQGSALVALLSPLAQPERMADLAGRGVTSFSLDAIPRVTRAQSMDVLSAMATVAGYRAVILAAELSGRFFPLLMTAAGTVAPARVLVLGAGVAGLQAVATARRLGAVVHAFDARPAVKEQVESLGAAFLSVPDVVAEGEGGYARAVGADEEARERQALAEPVAASDVVITTAMVPGARAPLLVDEAMVGRMRPGSVIVDLAAESGGNCAATQAGTRVVTANGVMVEGATDLVSQMPLPASQLFSRAVVNFLRLVLERGLDSAEGGAIQAKATDDEILRATLVTSAGEVVHEATRRRLTSVR
jgi:NAD(P) transhydrogenase subunit alpha